MKFKGIRIYFLGCNPESEHDFNFWYDSDHVPENRALPGIFHAQRYVATPELMALRMDGTLEENGAKYLSVYFAEIELQETKEYMALLSKRLREKNRFPSYFHGVYRGNYGLDFYATRQDLIIDPGAVPVMPHNGIYLTLDELNGSDDEKSVLDYYEKDEVPFMLGCPGVAAAFRFRCLEPPYLNHVLHFFFLDGDPASAAGAIRKRLSEQGMTEELNVLAGKARRMFAGPYRTIIPMQHDFLSL